jgi:hypothetical protein
LEFDHYAGCEVWNDGGDDFFALPKGMVECKHRRCYEPLTKREAEAHDGLCYQHCEGAE